MQYADIILNDKASLSLNCSDLFDTMRMKVRNRYAGQHIDLNMGQYSRTVSVKFDTAVPFQ